MSDRIYVGRYAGPGVVAWNLWAGIWDLDDLNVWVHYRNLRRERRSVDVTAVMQTWVEALAQRGLL